MKIAPNKFLLIVMVYFKQMKIITVYTQLKQLRNKA